MPPARHSDPRLGVFETLLVVEGRAVELETHLERIAASLEEIFDSAPPAGARDLVVERAGRIRLGRLRLTIALGSDGVLAADVVAGEIEDALFFPSRGGGATLRSVHLEGGLGSHKWVDRSSLGKVSDDAIPLLLDRCDEVLEAGRANVFAVAGEALATPPADGRILPGIARAGAIAVAREAGIEVAERPLVRGELLAAEEVFLTGSVRGVEPACSLDGTQLSGVTDVSRRVGDGLRRRWML